jgi:hypothetical protein
MNVNLVLFRKALKKPNLRPLPPKNPETPPNYKSTVHLENNFYFFQCPHCLGGVQVQTNEVACKIFRHGAYKSPGNPPIPPHASLEECTRLLQNNLVTGCAKPFLFVFNPSGIHHVEKCGYI